MVKRLVVNINNKFFFHNFRLLFETFDSLLFVLVFVILSRFWFIKPINANIHDFHLRSINKTSLFV